MIKQPLKILCFGAGAIGTYIGGSLAATGQHVVFYERESMVNLLKETGLRIQLIDNREYVVERPIVESDLEKLLKENQFDFAIVAVKAFDTEELLLSWQGLEDYLPTILCLQNGVENEPKMEQILGNKVISGTVTTAIAKPGPGRVKVERLRGVGIEQQGTLSESIVYAMNHAGLNAELFNQADSMKWSKMITNLIANASSAILGLPPKEIFSNYDLYRIEVEQIREALKVMDAMQINIVNLPGTPVKLLSFAVKYLHPRVSQPIIKNALTKGRGNKMPSLFLDIEMGREKSEVDFLNGAVVRFGEKYGVDCHVNQFLNEVLSKIVNHEIAREEFLHNPQKLVDSLDL